MKLSKIKIKKLKSVINYLCLGINLVLFTFLNDSFSLKAEEPKNLKDFINQNITDTNQNVKDIVHAPGMTSSSRYFQSKLQLPLLVKYEEQNIQKSLYDWNTKKEFVDKLEKEIFKALQTIHDSLNPQNLKLEIVLDDNQKPQYNPPLVVMKAKNEQLFSNSSPIGLKISNELNELTSERIDKTVFEQKLKEKDIIRKHYTVQASAILEVLVLSFKKGIALSREDIRVEVSSSGHLEDTSGKAYIEFQVQPKIQSRYTKYLQDRTIEPITIENIILNKAKDLAQLNLTGLKDKLKDSITTNDNNDQNAKAILKAINEFNPKLKLTDQEVKITGIEWIEETNKGDDDHKSYRLKCKIEPKDQQPHIKNHKDIDVTGILVKKTEAEKQKDLKYFINSKITNTNDKIDHNNELKLPLLVKYSGSKSKDDANKKLAIEACPLDADIFNVLKNIDDNLNNEHLTVNIETHSNTDKDANGYYKELSSPAVKISVKPESQKFDVGPSIKLKINNHLSNLKTDNLKEKLTGYIETTKADNKKDALLKAINEVNPGLLLTKDEVDIQIVKDIEETACDEHYQYYAIKIKLSAPVDKKQFQGEKVITVNNIKVAKNQESTNNNQESTQNQEPTPKDQKTTKPTFTISFSLETILITVIAFTFIIFIITYILKK